MQTPQRERGVRRSTVSLVLLFIIYAISNIITNYILTSLLPNFGIQSANYAIYASIALALIFGYLIVNTFSNLIYLSLLKKYGHPTASAIRSTFKIIGIGALLSALAGGVAGGASGVALGGFLGIVVGFASQQILGQALAGLFLLITRPFNINDHVTISGEDGIVIEISTLFTVIAKNDGTRVLIPNNSIIGNKVLIIPKG